MGFGDFGNVSVRVRVVDFIQGDDCWEFGGYEGGHQGGDFCGGPCFERGFEGEGVEGTGDGGWGAAVAGELVLKGVDGVCF